MDLGSALLALVIALVVKLAVMVFGAWLLLRVYRSGAPGPHARPWLLIPPQDAGEVRVLWWALVLFYLSELTCGVEVYVLFRSSAILSGTHSILSALAMAFFSLGVYLQLQHKLFHYTEPACLLKPICQSCTVRQGSGCKFRVLLLLTATMVALAALLPLFASIERMNADTSRFMLPFPGLNAWYDQSVVPWLQANVAGYQPSGVAFYLPESMLWIEFRLIPVLSLVAALIAIGFFLRGKGVQSARQVQAMRMGAKVLVVAMGMLSYSYFELLLYRGTGDVLLGSLGHELGEFWFLVFTAEYLRQCFPPRTTSA